MMLDTTSSESPSFKLAKTARYYFLSPSFLMVYALYVGLKVLPNFDL